MSMNLAQGGLRIPEFTVGERMRKAREEAGLSQEEMATEIGIARRSIGRYEAGTAVKKSVLLLYAMRTQVPVEWLETGKCTPRDLNPEPTGYGSLRRVAALAA